jgi:hypothetical protein
VDGRDKPGHDEKASDFQSVRKSLKMLDAFSVRLRDASRRTEPRYDCICIKDDITSVLSACVGFDPMPPPTPLVVFCMYWLTACWNDVPMEGELDCDFACGGASTLGLLPTAETMTAFSKSREQIASLCYGLMVNAR